MRMAGLVLRLACAAAVNLAALPTAPPAQAQAEALVPDQPWYPEGYHDLRIAAALHAETFARPASHMVFEDFDDPQAKTYDLLDCDLFDDVPEGLDEEEAERAQLALDIAQMRRDFATLGYPREVYDQPLLDYERWALTGFQPVWSERLVALLAAYPDGPPEEFLGPGQTEQEIADLELLINGDMLTALKNEFEVRRQRLSPELPRIVASGGCGAGESEFEIRMVPANGELWLINAFAFRVCERKVADPWNHQACSWSQYGEGDNTFASGRYMYEARWPNGTVKRGARVLEGSFEEEEDGAETVITFRR